MIQEKEFSHHDLYDMLKNPSVPGHRVFRKAAGLTLGLLIALVVYRHLYLELDTLKSVFGTATRAALLVFVVGLSGGLGAAALYDNFLEKVGATETKPFVSTFIVEWLVALCAPVIGLIAAVVFFQVLSHAPG